MEHVIHMAAIAIERHRNEEELREFSRRLYQSQDEERRRIARELHDSTGQKLALLAMNLSMVKDDCPMRRTNSRDFSRSAHLSLRTFPMNSEPFPICFIRPCLMTRFGHGNRVVCERN